MICCKKLRSNKIMHNSHCIPIVTAPEFLRCKKLTTFFRILRYYLIFCSAPGTTIIYFMRPAISFLVLRCGLVILQFPYLYLFTTLKLSYIGSRFPALFSVVYCKNGKQSKIACIENEKLEIQKYQNSF